MYNKKPPFEITNAILDEIAEIAELVGQVNATSGLSTNPMLRRTNRIRTIHASLAIEQNTLTLEQVTAILNGKRVIGPPKDIAEAKNAYEIYEMMDQLDPYSVDDLLNAHAVMTRGLVEESGCFRSGPVGVVDKKGNILHFGTLPDNVPGNTMELLDWVRDSDYHMLIKSCVFHYEFEFIHPFADGNGRIGRLWQSLILGKLNPLFEHLPVENMVYANQQAYYDAITQSSAKGDSQPFIDFMLQEILNALEDHKGQTVDEIGEANSLSENEIKILGLIRSDRHMSAKRFAEEIGASPRQVERILAGMKDRAIIRRVGANRNGYW